MKRTRRKIMKIHRVFKNSALRSNNRKEISIKRTVLVKLSYISALSSLTFIPFPSSPWIKSNKSSLLIELRFCDKYFYICLYLSLSPDKIPRQFANLALWLSNRLIIFFIPYYRCDKLLALYNVARIFIIMSSFGFLQIENGRDARPV